MNNFAYGNIKIRQQTKFGNRLIGCEYVGQFVAARNVPGNAGTVAVPYRGPREPFELFEAITVCERYGAKLKLVG